MPCLKQGTRLSWKECARSIGRQADFTRGLFIGRYAKEARLVLNAPLQHEGDPFLKESLDQHFGLAKSHFYSVDKKNRPLVNIFSKVIDRLKNVSPRSPS